MKFSGKSGKNIKKSPQKSCIQSKEIWQCPKAHTTFLSYGSVPVPPLPPQFPQNLPCAPWNIRKFGSSLKRKYYATGCPSCEKGIFIKLHLAPSFQSGARNFENRCASSALLIAPRVGIKKDRELRVFHILMRFSILSSSGVTYEQLSNLWNAEAR